MEASPGEGVVLPPEAEGKSPPGSGEASPRAGAQTSPEVGEEAFTGEGRGGVASTGTVEAVASTGTVEASGKAPPETGVGSAGGEGEAPSE